MNNVVEADHGKLKQLTRAVRGFKSLKTAYATIRGSEVMRALHKGQAALWQYGGGIMGEVPSGRVPVRRLHRLSGQRKRD